MRVPHIDSALTLIGVLGSMVDAYPLNLSVETKVFRRGQKIFISKCLRDANHIEQVILDDAMLQE